MTRVYVSGAMGNILLNIVVKGRKNLELMLVILSEDKESEEVEEIKEVEAKAKSVLLKMMEITEGIEIFLRTINGFSKRERSSRRVK